MLPRSNVDGRKKIKVAGCINAGQFGVMVEHGLALKSFADGEDDGDGAFCVTLCARVGDCYNARGRGGGVSAVTDVFGHSR